jgi:hypothetical protein
MGRLCRRIHPRLIFPCRTSGSLSESVLNMSEQKWTAPFLESLRQLADVGAQKQAWVEHRLSEFPAPEELICQVFDDSGIDDALVAGGVFSTDADGLLRQLSRAVGGLDVSRQPARLLADAEWLRVVDLAGQALAAISHGLRARGGD